VLSGAALAAVELGVVTAETGQTVVYRAIVEVTTMIERAG